MTHEQDHIPHDQVSTVEALSGDAVDVGGALTVHTEKLDGGDAFGREI